MHTYTHYLAALQAHLITSTRTPLHQYRRTLHWHTYILVVNYTYTIEMPNITPSYLKHLTQKVRE